jgi:cyclase
MHVCPLERDIVVATGEQYSSNATIFLAEHGGLLVDALGSTADAEALHRYLEQQHIPVRLIVLTHGFSDHLAGLSCFPKAPILAHERTPETHAMEQLLTEEEARFYRAPTFRIRDFITIDWGAHRLEVSHRPGHTPSALMIDVPDADLLLSGDTTVGNVAYLKYAEIGALENSLHWAKSLNRKRVVQGHSGVGDPRCFEHALQYIAELRRWAQSTSTAIPTLARCLPKGIEGTDFETIFHERNVHSIKQGSLKL